jgi:anti-sigma B factor antagonist
MRDEMVESVTGVSLTTVAIDFRDVEFMGTVGFLALMNLRRHLPDSRIALCELGPHLKRVVVACRLINDDPKKPSVFEIADSVVELPTRLTRGKLMTEEAFIQSYTTEEGILVIKLHGSLDAAGTEPFNQEIQKHIEAGQSRMIIDCAHLGFISSLGIGALIALQVKLAKRGGAAKLSAVQGVVADVLRVVRVDKALGIYGDIEFARQAFVEEAAAKSE